MDDDIRDSISEVFDAAEKPAEASPLAAALTPAPAPPSGEASPAPAISAPAPAPSPAPAQPGTAPAPSEQPADTIEAQAPSPTPAPEDPYAKAPGSWSPAAREKWGSIGPEAREEIWKRDREALRAMNISTEARRHVDEFNRTMQPFLGFIAAENSTPMQAVHNMMQTAATLRVGTAQQKVQVIAEAIKTFGVDLRALDSVLAGQQPEFNPQVAIDQAIQRHMQPLQQQLQQYQGFFTQQQEQISQSATNEVEQFAAKHEFFNDVRPLVADLMESSMRRGQPVDLTQAYQAAILIHEPVRRVVEARKQAQQAQQQHQQAQAARGAAVSVTPSATAQQAKPVQTDDLRAAIESAIANTGGR